MTAIVLRSLDECIERWDTERWEKRGEVKKQLPGRPKTKRRMKVKRERAEGCLKIFLRGVLTMLLLGYSEWLG